ncbi:hypothetical protein TNCV_3005221 [Trichonephila clavipes]|nr:hypothetical protein TNCV_3005221 [Trichonephila clavipes]
MSSKKGTTRWRQKTTCGVFGEDAATARTCQRWLTKFCTVDFSLKDKPSSGRPSDFNGTVLRSESRFIPERDSELLLVCRKQSLNNISPELFKRPQGC